MSSADIIVVGAGASGLMVARKLHQAGLKVIILEARERLGGRIHTIEEAAFLTPVEAGAEFIHGNLPVTMALLKEAHIDYRVSSGEAWRFTNGRFTQDDDFIEDGELLAKKLREVKEDTTVATFLDTYFSDAKYQGLKNSVKGFVEGYDAADINRASVLTLKKEWAENEEWEQYRVDGGYLRMISFLGDQCRKQGCMIYRSSIVKEIKWQAGKVEVTTASQQRYTGKKIIVTVPLGVLSAEDGAEASIQFLPALPQKVEAFHKLGYGGVIKIILLFNRAFWKDHEPAPGKSLEDMGWLFSEASIPTWWTQVPDDASFLTGWLAGPKAQQWKDANNSVILREALQSLCTIFGMSKEALIELLAYSSITNWLADPFALGAYSYSTPETAAAIKLINTPVENTLFFAGEALYDGPETGTVEGALANGLAVARQVLEGMED